MKKALSIILVFVMMFALLPVAFAGNTIEVKAGSTIVESGAETWTFTNGEITIYNQNITEISIAGDSNVTLSFAVSPVSWFEVRNSIEGLTVKPAVSMPNGLCIKKCVDYPVTIEFDPNQDSAIGNGLLIIPDGTTITSISSEDVLVSNGRKVSILLANPSAANPGESVAAVNTAGSLQFKRSGSIPTTFEISTTGPSSSLSRHICAVNASNLKIDSGVTLKASIEKSTDTDIYNAVQAEYLDISKGAAVQATVTGGEDTFKTTAVFATTFENSGTVRASVDAGTATVYARYLSFKDGIIEAINPSGNAVAFPVILNVEENAKAIGGDDADHALEIEDPENSDSYRNKKYVKLYVPNGLSLDKSTISLAVGQTSTLTATTIPTEATIADWTVPTADADKVTLTKNGKECSVKAEKAGTATITVTDSNGNTASCSVSVTDAPATSISLNKTTLSIPLDGSFTLVATTDPASATVGTEGWTKDNDNVSLTKDGKNCKVTGDKVGTSIVKVKDSNNNETSCTVTVTGAAGIDIYDPAAELYSLGSVGEVVRFRASVTPEWTADNNNDIRWTSSNENVAKVTAIEPHGTGAYIEATGAGSAAITASCGGQSKMVSVVVISDYKFTAPTGKLIWYYDRNPQYNLEFSTNIANPVRVTIQAGNKEYDFTKNLIRGANGAMAIPYSALYTTFGRQTTTMTVKVFYGPGANDYIYKNLYYRSVYDAPLTADTDMTWAYVTMLVAGLFISASPLILKKAKRRGAAQ